MAKVKMKTHKANKKVLTVRPGGSISFKQAGRNKQDYKKPTGKIKRQKRKVQALSKGDRNRLKSVI